LEPKRNVVASAAQDPTKDENEIPDSLRFITNALSLGSVVCFSGIIFGWAPLELMLFREAQEQHEQQDQNYPQQQMQHFNAIFTVAQFLLSFSSLPVGFLVDHAPKPIYFGVTAILQVAGLVLFAYDIMMLGYAFMALGGCMTMLGSFPASFLLPRYQAGILAAISCLFDASSIVFFVFHRLNLHQPHIFTRRRLFLAWAGVAFLVFGSLAICWSIVERKDWKKILDQEASAASSNSTTNTTSTDSEERGEHNSLATKPKNDQDGIASDDNSKMKHQQQYHQRSALQQLCTFEFALVLIFASTHMLRCNFYIMTVDDFLSRLGDTESVYANLFSIILPSGIIYVPLIEKAIDLLGVVQTLYVTNGLGVLFGAIQIASKSLVFQAVDFFVFTGFRAFLYASMNTMIAFYFGVNTMGRMIGFTFTLAAIVSLLQYPAALYADQQSSINTGEGNFPLMNGIMLCLCVLPIGSLFLYDRTATTQTKNKSGQIPEGCIGTDEIDGSNSISNRSPGMLLTSPGSELRNSLRQVQQMRRKPIPE